MHTMKTEETSNPEITKQKVIGLLTQAKDEVWMSTGFNSDFYNDEKVKKTMTEAFKRVKDIRVIIDGDINKTEVPWFFALAKELKQKLQIRQHKEILHWLIVDGKNCRLEKVHPIGLVGVDNLLVYDVPLPISENLKKTYNDWWVTGKPIDP